MAKSPAFQFYVNEWLGSTKIMLMTPAEEGAYIRLLAIAWGEKDCGLPDNDEKLAVLSRLGEGWFKGGADKIRQCFISRNGRLYNDRLLIERKKQKEWREKSKAGGIASGKARKIKALEAKGGSQMVEPLNEPNGNSSFTSSSSSSKKEKDIVSVPPPPPCPYQKIGECYHRILPELPRIEAWTNQRITHVRARWREDPNRQNMEWWEWFFKQVRKSPFLMGEKAGSQGSVFRASLPWLMQPEKFARVIEGVYLDRGEGKSLPGHTQTNLEALRQFEEKEGREDAD